MIARARRLKENRLIKVIFVAILTNFASRVLSDGVIGNTSDFGSEESRFEP